MFAFLEHLEEYQLRLPVRLPEIPQRTGRTRRFVLWIVMAKGAGRNCHDVRVVGAGGA